MTGSKLGAEQGTLVLMCGGSAETLAAARPLLEAVATKIIHVGPVGSATRVKLIGNTMIALMLEALCEGLATCQAAGVDAAKLLEVVQARATSRRTGTSRARPSWPATSRPTSRST